MILEILILLLVILLIYVVIKKGYENEHYFRDRNIKSMESSFIMGGSGRVVLGKETMFDFIIRAHNRFPEEKIYGLLDLRTPIVCIRDPELLKHLTVKEFDHFTDHRAFVDEKIDPLFGNSLVLLKGQKWRDMRATLSPAFTGSKMRKMFQLILDVSEQFMTSLRNEARPETGMLEYEMKEICSRFANDVIAISAFGIRVDSMDDKDNEFYDCGKEMVNFTKLSNVWKFLCIRFCPELSRIAGIQMFTKSLQNFFKGMVLRNMKEREESNIHCADMIDLLLEVKKGTPSHQNMTKENDSAGFATVEESEIGLKVHQREWTDDELIAQCFLFFFAGFDTSSSAMSFAIYELTINPEYQERLYQEVNKVHEDLKGEKLSYEVLQKMKFLDMITSETLRKWPPASVMDRECVKDLDYDDGKGFKYRFEKSTGLWLTIAAFHHDPKYFPNPTKFDPERFSEENKHKINPNAYIPFGVGPRNCIGSRFALLQVKALLYHLVLNFSFHVIERTEIPIKVKNSFSALNTVNGIWVGLKMRE